ncbi:MAG TPA: hypothetical protein VMS71_04235, partial [Candidatus Acidoferrum sp.]|nr:hypothetical protein [Candidatus Acidoferrum sp.]
MSSAQAPTTEEIVVSFEVPRLVSKDILVRYDGTTVYLPVTEVLHMLDLNITTDIEAKRSYGFLFSRSQQYELDFGRFSADIDGKKRPLLSSDFLSDDHEFYLRVDMFETLFGFKMTFDFSLLRVLLPLNQDFPAYQKLQRKLARQKLQASITSLKGVHEIPRRHEYFAGGTADWALSANPVGGGGQYLDLNLGGMVLGGDISLSGSGNTVTGFDSRQLNYKWHYCFNPNPYVSQVELGNVYSSGALSRSLDGAVVTNRPQIQRTYFQTINLTGKLDPGWEIELYVDNKLTDWASADEKGEYDFNLDIVYGSSLITLKMYGPNGEIRTEEQYVRVPYNLVPKKKLEYTVAGGSGTMLATTGTYAQASSYYGLFNTLTVGASSDLPVGSKVGEKPLFATEATWQVIGDLTANGSFAPNYQAQAGLNYAMPSFLNANATFTKYYENPFRNNLDQLYNTTISLSAPI